MSAIWQQQVFALDARFNAHRAPNHPNFRTLYIRRRNQLLREYSKGEDSDVRKQYLKLRSQLLQQRYGLAYDQASLQSRSMSARSSSRVSESPDYGGWEGGTHKDHKDNTDTTTLVPTRQAEASRAIVGGTTIAENYAFVGVHHIFDQHTAAVTMVKFAHNDRSRLCCVSNDGTVSICNVTSTPPCVECVLAGHKKPVTGCDWSAANDLVVSCSQDGSLCLWDVASHSCLRSVQGQAELLACLFQPANNNMVITGNGRGMVEVLNVSTGICPRGGNNKMGGRVLSLAFEASGQLLWAGNDKGVIMSFTFELETGRLTKSRKMVLTDDCGITCISWRAWISREARDPLLLVNSANNSVSLLRVVDRDGSLQLKRKISIRHKSNRYLIRSTFCPIMSFRQGACIVSGSEDSCVYFLDVERESKSVVNKLQGHACPVLGVSFNYDESLLATSDCQGLVIIWSRERRS